MGHLICSRGFEEVLPCFWGVNKELLAICFNLHHPLLGVDKLSLFLLEPSDSFRHLNQVRPALFQIVLDSSAANSVQDMTHHYKLPCPDLVLHTPGVVDLDDRRVGHVPLDPHVFFQLFGSFSVVKFKNRRLCSLVSKDDWTVILDDVCFLDPDMPNKLSDNSLEVSPQHRCLQLVLSQVLLLLLFQDLDQGVFFIVQIFSGFLLYLFE
jgi:hypothetical protein